MKKLKADEFYRYHMLSDLKISPEGTGTAFLVSQVADDKKYRTELLVLQEGETRCMASEVAAYCWKDETAVLYSVKTEEDNGKKGARLWEIYEKGMDGEARIFARLPVPVSDLQKIAENVILFSSSIDVNCPDYDKLEESEKEEYHRKKEEEADYIILDELPFMKNGKHFTNGVRNALFLYTADDGCLKRITGSTYDVEEFSVTGDYVVYRGSAYIRKSNCNGSVMSYNIKTGETTCLMEEGRYRCWLLNSWNGMPMVKINAADHPMGCGSTGYFYSLDPESGKLSQISEFECNRNSTVSSDCRLSGGKTVCAVSDATYFVTTRGCDGILKKIDANGTVTSVIEKEGSLDFFDVCEKTGTIHAVCMYENHLQEVYEIDEAEGIARQLTHINEGILDDVYVADCEECRFWSCGQELDGFVLRPKDFDPEKRYPAILEIHGGPKVAYGKVFFHEMQYLANEGYFVFFCNPTGSDGRGFEFAHIHGKWGTVDYQNLMDFTDQVLKKYPQIDQDRLGVTGGSYGGFMTNWVIGHTDRFAAAVSQRSIANQVTSYGVSDIGFFCTWEEAGGTMYDAFEQVWESSPLKHLKKVSTPTLFLHSDQDHRCSVEEGMQMFSALCEADVPTKLFIFKGENHELSRGGQPAHRVRRLTELLSWMNRYL
ncbi:MAG: S9 family peptidase [Lachnospiraceae bacterium]|nr:S9 family peptidase [Lachnospiraceae bacterium]